MPNNTQTVIELLTSELNAVDEKISTCKEELSGLTARRKQLVQSLTPLTRESNGQPSKPAPKKTDAIRVVAEVLTEHESLERDDLEKAASERIRQTHSLAGFSLRFREALETDRFVSDDEGVRIAETSALHDQTKDTQQ